MKYNIILIRYGEIFLKSERVRKKYESILLKNIKRSLSKEKIDFELKIERGRYFLETEQIDESVEVLKKVFGIHSISPCIHTKLNELNSTIEQISKKLVQNETFKIEVHRVGEHDFSSQDLAKRLGAIVLENSKSSVNVKEPDKTIWVEVRDQDVYIFTDKILCYGGLPVGASGRSISLLSGGIDSPVSSWMIMSRGAPLDFIHVYALREESENENNKIFEIIKVLGKYQNTIRFWFAPYYFFEMASINVPKRYQLILFRRFLSRLATNIGEMVDAKGLVLGDSLAQVASQTLESMYCFDDATSLSVLRPLIGMSKEDIIKISKKIDTYELSLYEYKDCCSLVSQQPTTRPKLEIVKAIENEINMQNIVQMTINEIKEYIYADGKIIENTFEKKFQV